MHVVLIEIDGLQAAAVGVYGNEWIPTPHLDRFAAEAVVFDQHFADVPSVAGWHSALHLGRHAFPPINQTHPLSESALQRLLERHGLQLLELEPVGERHYPKGLTYIEFPNVALHPPWSVSDEFLADAFAEWELEDLPEPWLDPTGEWLNSEDNLGSARVQRTYGAAVRQFDASFGELWQGLEQSSIGQSALVIVTARRGQNLGEHGLIGNSQPWLHEELVHLPLFIRLPRGEHGGRRIAHLTQSVDLAPTILDFLGVGPPIDWHGHSLLPLCQGDGPVRSYVCMGNGIADHSEYALQTPDAKIIAPHCVANSDSPRSAMYFIKPDDRWEVNDLRLPNLDEFERLEAAMWNYIAASARSGPLIAPALPSPESTDANRETGGREHDRSADSGGL